MYGDRSVDSNLGALILSDNGNSSGNFCFMFDSQVVPQGSYWEIDRFFMLVAASSGLALDLVASGVYMVPSSAPSPIAQVNSSPTVQAFAAAIPGVKINDFPTTQQTTNLTAAIFYGGQYRRIIVPSNWKLRVVLLNTGGNLGAGTTCTVYILYAQMQNCAQG